MTRIILVLLMAGLGASVARAEGPFGIDLGLGLLKRKPKAESTTRVKALVATLQSDPDEKKRRQAAEDLRGFDPRNNPEVMTALIGTLQKDPSPAVRTEAADAIGKLKPVFQPAGIAMELALTTDPDPKVREAVKASLWQYHLNGYRTPAGNPLSTQTGEPPLALGRPSTPSRPQTAPSTSTDSGFRPITNGIGKGVVYQPTPEPPLAKPKSPEKSEPPVLPIPLPSSSVPEPTPLPAASPSVPLPPVPTVPVPPKGGAN